ncbi:MAG TPA: hypothetical protein VK712_01860 [Verrucomicrobiae bacterium]|jgi:hypothetical protein|nr:hypothetical protein [Verrucomicrobiae bacterium]
MQTLEIGRAADDALGFNEVMQQEFGSGLQVGETLLVTEHDKLVPNLAFAYERTNEATTYTAIRADQNITELKPGMGFGLLTESGVAPAIVSQRSSSSALHVLYLSGEAILPRHIGVPGYEPNELQRALLQGVNPFQERSVGSETADSTASTASEGGHSMLGLKGLTDKTARQAIMGGEHIVHSVAERPTGIMPAFSQPGSTGLGMLSSPERPIVPDEKIVRTGDSVWLIDHPHYRAISVPTEGLPASSELIVLGIGLLAAKSQLQQSDTQLRDGLLQIMERI